MYFLHFYYWISATRTSTTEAPRSNMFFPFSLLMLMSILNYKRHCSFLPNTILVLYIPSMQHVLTPILLRCLATSKWGILQFFRLTTLQIKPGRIIFLFFAPFNLLYVRTIYLLLLFALFVNNNLIHLICSNVNGRTTGYQDPITWWAIRH